MAPTHPAGLKSSHRPIRRIDGAQNGRLLLQPKGNIETGEVEGQATAKRFDVSFLARPPNEECASLILTREGPQRFDFSAREKSLCYASSG